MRGGSYAVLAAWIVLAASGLASAQSLLDPDEAFSGVEGAVEDVLSDPSDTDVDPSDPGAGASDAPPEEGDSSAGSESGSDAANGQSSGSDGQSPGTSPSGGASDEEAKESPSLGAMALVGLLGAAAFRRRLL